MRRVPMPIMHFNLIKILFSSCSYYLMILCEIGILCISDFSHEEEEEDSGLQLLGKEGNLDWMKTTKKKRFPAAMPAQYIILPNVGTSTGIYGGDGYGDEERE